MALQESGEMYLETILILSQTGDRVRSIDVSDQMGYSKPSVSRAVSLLRRDGYLTVEEDGGLVLTEAGLVRARKIYERHTMLKDCLVRLGVSPETAAADACRIEHVISDETFEALKRHAG